MNDSLYPRWKGHPLLSKKKAEIQKLFMDRRVQLFLGKFLGGELDVLNPVIKKTGYHYPGVEPFVDDPDEAESFLSMLQGHGLINSEVVGLLAQCGNCKSYDIDSVASSRKGKIEKTDKAIWRCRDCGALLDEGGLVFQQIYSYHFSKRGIDEISDRLVVKPLRDFLGERGYSTKSPGKLLGESDVEHVFDIVAFSGNLEEGILAMDFVVSENPVEESHVASMFAKVYDTTPLKSILVVFPGLTRDARMLAEQYKIDVVETRNIKSIWIELRKVIPPVDELRYEPLDVMTLLSLPDHRRKTATVTSNLGKATAEEISEKTERARAVESGYLNQLVRMGYLKKERVGRRVLFSVIS